jgi:YfiH family protein
MIKSKLIGKYKNISHGFFNKSGGHSDGIYRSLNCGKGSKDNKSNINKNLKKVCLKIGCSKSKLVLLNQIHSNKVFSINNISKKKPTGDALVTYVNKYALGILTADCAPIFIFDPKKKIIAAIHAGWKGAYKKIIYKTVYDLKKKGSNIQDLIVVIGPCISKYNYEVKKDFLKKFINQNKKNRRFFNFSKKKIFFSLNEYIKNQLKDIGVKNIEIINKDTYLRKNNFFSYRRSLKNKYYDYGRNISVIMIK